MMKISAFLLVGDIRGLVRLCFLSNNKIINIWEEEDLIPVADFLVFPHQKDLWTVTVVKGSCLIIATMGPDGNILQTGAKNFESGPGITGKIR